MARRTSPQVTRDAAVDVSRLLIESRVTPHMLAVLIGQPASVITGWFVRGIRPTQKVMREATSTLKRVIALREAGLRTDNVVQLRKALADEPQVDVMEIRSAYFSPAPKNRDRGTVSVTTMGGKVFEFQVSRAAYHRWEQNDFRHDCAPKEVYFSE
jgi:hypothetical protein